MKTKVDEELVNCRHRIHQVLNEHRENCEYYFGIEQQNQENQDQVCQSMPVVKYYYLLLFCYLYT